MIPLPANLRSRDIDQWLYECFCLIDDGETLVSYLHTENEDDGTTVVVVEDVNGYVQQVYPEDVSAWWPVVGAVNLHDENQRLMGAWFVTRNQQRQYRRSLDLGQCTIDCPRAFDMRRIDPDYVESPARWAIARALHRPKYYTVREAVQMIDRKTAYRVAVNRHMIVVGNRGKLLLYYMGTAVGRIDDEYNVRLTGLGRKRSARIRSLLKGDCDVYCS